MFTKQRASAEALNSAASFYSRISQAGKKQAEADLLGLKDPQKYRRNTFGRYLVTAVLLFQLCLIAVVAYFGGFYSAFQEWQDWEDVEVWQRLWASSTPLWSVLIANAGVCLLSGLASSSRRVFLRTPKKPLALFIIVVMSVSSFVFFLHPLDSVFYCGMLLVGVQNYFWLLLLVEPSDPVAAWIHPFVHGGSSGVKGKDGHDGEQDETTETSQILKSQRIEELV